jgi:hypothetical protein
MKHKHAGLANLDSQLGRNWCPRSSYRAIHVSILHAPVHQDIPQFAVALCHSIKHLTSIPEVASISLKLDERTHETIPYPEEADGRGHGGGDSADRGSPLLKYCGIV